MKAIPYSDYLICEPIEEEQRSGFLIPEVAREKIRQAKIIEVGPGNGDYAMQSKVGYIVMHNEARAIKFVLEGKELMIIREQDCFLRLIPE